MSKRKCPYDNTCIKSFHAILKKELHCTQYVMFKQTTLALLQYIERFYNCKRIYIYTRYKTPQAIKNWVKEIA
ncbi:MULTISPECIES: IS3 family transposase [Bacillus]|uniref:IS3 family transposase n=1 Tax=Bacillus TaxID=1386 RepID=UPI00349F7C46